MRTNTILERWAPVAFAAVVLAAPLLALVAPVRAQERPDRVRERIEQSQGLSEQQRARLRANLQQCLDLGMESGQVEALFRPGEGNAEEGWSWALRQQERVLNMARDGMPADLVVDKLREGRTKGAREGAIEQVMTRMEAQVRIAHRQMTQARQEGVAPSGDAAVDRAMVRGVALDLWRGMEEGDLEHLRGRARERLRDHDCSTVDLAAASESATQLREQGMERRRAVELVGEALRQGYTAHEMRQIAWMAAAAQARGATHEEVAGRLQEHLGQHEPMGDMLQHMAQWGWMGPGDEHGGHGQHSPIDDHLGGHHGGSDDSGGHGGSGDGGGSGGQGGGGHGGGGH